MSAKDCPAGPGDSKTERNFVIVVLRASAPIWVGPSLPRSGGAGAGVRGLGTDAANLRGLVLGGGGGRPDYLQKLKVPEGYEKMIDYSNI